MALRAYVRVEATIDMAKLDNDGDTAEVQGSGAKPYLLKNVAGVLSCSCPAWRMFGGTIDKRTCKHLKKLRGEAAEAARIGGPAAPVAPAQASPVAAKAAGTQAAANLAAGKKLRQDEKAKLYGPPLLFANRYEDETDLDVTGWWVSEKLDGVRAYWNGTDFISRQGNVFHAPEWFKAGLPSHKLDGELWMGRQMFQTTLSVVRSGDSGYRWKEVTYLVFDHPDHTGPFEDRMTYLLNLEANSAWKHAKVLEQERIDDSRKLKPMLDRYVALGAEGLMIRKPGSS